MLHFPQGTGEHLWVVLALVVVERMVEELRKRLELCGNGQKVAGRGGREKCQGA